MWMPIYTMIKSLAELLQHACKCNPIPLAHQKTSYCRNCNFGSEFVAARIATDQIIDLRYTLMYPGVPIRSKSYMFGDNKSLVDSASIPTSALSKRDQLYPPSIESEKLLLQGTHNSTGKMENLILQTS